VTFFQGARETTLKKKRKAKSQTTAKIKKRKAKAKNMPQIITPPTVCVLFL